MLHPSHFINQTKNETEETMFDKSAIKKKKLIFKNKQVEVDLRMVPEGKGPGF